MVERRKKRKRKDDGTDLDRMSIPEKPSKDEYAVAKWIRNNVQSKKTKFDKNHIVEYFTGTRAVDALLERSPWNKTIFESRQHVVDFLEIMLRHKFFHRAKKIVIKEDELSKVRSIKKKGKEIKEKDEKKGVEKNKEKDNKEKEEVKEGEEKKENAEKTDEPKRKPKVRLEMHMEQCFVDCNDAYVWIYEPVSVYYWFFGTLLVLGATGVCLFPLWPLTVRHRVWYLSIAAAIFLIFILALIVIRIIVFCLIWVLTFGRHHFLILPNLIEDVGFFASFWPLYKYEYHDPKSDAEKKNKKKKRKKDKDSGSEDAPLIQQDVKSEEAFENQIKNDKVHYSKTSNEEEEEEGEEEDEEEKSTAEVEPTKGKEGSEEASDSDKSHTGEDFEML